MNWSYWLSALGLAGGAGMGAWGLVDPNWAARLVRLRDDPDKPGGFAEFRGTYGGLFLASHGAALWLLIGHVADASGALIACGAMWIGTGIGRAVAVVRDGVDTKFNRASIAFEAGLGLAILAPILVR